MSGEDIFDVVASAFFLGASIYIGWLILKMSRFLWRLDHPQADERARCGK
jgi:hypothetical protein